MDIIFFFNFNITGWVNASNCCRKLQSFFVWTKPLDCWWRGWWRGLPAAAIDSSSPSFSTTPMNQYTIWNFKLLTGREGPCQQLLWKTANHLCGAHGSTMNQPIGQSGTLGVMQTWGIQLVEWSIDNTLL